MQWQYPSCPSFEDPHSCPGVKFQSKWILKQLITPQQWTEGCPLQQCEFKMVFVTSLKNCLFENDGLSLDSLGDGRQILALNSRSTPQALDADIKISLTRHYTREAWPSTWFVFNIDLTYSIPPLTTGDIYLMCSAYLLLYILTYAFGIHSNGVSSFISTSNHWYLKFAPHAFYIGSLNYFF